MLCGNTAALNRYHSAADANYADEDDACGVFSFSLMDSEEVSKSVFNVTVDIDGGKLTTHCLVERFELTGETKACPVTKTVNHEIDARTLRTWKREDAIALIDTLVGSDGVDRMIARCVEHQIDTGEDHFAREDHLRIYSS